MKKHLLSLTILALTAAGCGETVSKNDRSRILAMGDSMLAAHSISRRAVSHNLERTLGEPVTDRSVMGARILYNLPISGSAGLNISKQYREGNWDWVVLNGGGNDLWLGCGCLVCKRKLDKLAAADGSGGQIPSLINKIRSTGARVIYVGYLRSPGVGSPIDHCRNDGDELERRVTTFAQRDPGVFVVSLKDLVPYGDTSYHGADMIHPSIKGSAAISQRIAQIIKQ